MNLNLIIEGIVMLTICKGWVLISANFYKNVINDR